MQSVSVHKCTKESIPPVVKAVASASRPPLKQIGKSYPYGGYQQHGNSLEIRSRRLGQMVSIECSGLQGSSALTVMTELSPNDEAMQQHPRLEVEQPRLTFTFREQAIEPGSKLSLKCVASGNPLPQVTWTLDGEHIVEYSGIRIGDYVTNDGFVNSFVNISSVKLEDGGVYRCRASNGINSIEHAARISVYGRPFVKTMRNVTAISGERVQLDCPYSGHPVESIGWEKGAEKLPQNHRQMLYPNGTLVIKKIERHLDEGHYRCVVSSKQQVDSAQLFIRVTVAPMISPFSAAPNLQEGMRSMLTCSILEGDPPFHFAWHKDGLPVQSSHDVRITSSNEFSSTLFINKVTYKDNGNFTCTVRNGASSASYSVHHNVKVPPRWTVTPNDSQIIEGHDVTIDCQATGHPQPRIWWEHAEHLAGSATPSHYKPIISNSHIYTLENGSLIIKESSKRDEGLYLCQASNAIGSGVSKVVKVTVKAPPKFKSPFDTVTARKGQPVEVGCEARGDELLTLVWSKDRLQFDPRLEHRYELSKLDGKQSLLETLKIKLLDRRDSALFTCFASNSYGSAEYNIQLIVQEPPDKPENLLATQIDSRSVRVSWTNGYTGNSAIMSYQLEFKGANNTWDSSGTNTETASGSSNSLTLSKLKPLTTYHVRLRAENSLGWSDYSDAIQFTTEEEAPSISPSNVQVYPVSSRSLHVTWSLSNPESRNGLVKGYYLGYKVLGSSEPYVFKTISLNDRSLNDHGSQEAKISDLRRATKYSVIVQAFNSKGPGPQSDESIGETMINDPPPPPTVSVGFVSQSSIELRWTFDESYPSRDNGQDHDDVVITGYNVHFKSPHSDWEERQISGHQAGGYTFDDLYCGTYYQFYIVAYNGVGKSDPSQVVATKTKGSPPEGPRVTSNAFLTNNSTAACIKLDGWRINGCPIKKFVIRYKQRAASDWILLSTNILPEQRLVELVDLRPGTWYSLLVVSHSDPGPSENEYTFATLTENGGTVSPLDLNRPKFTYTSLSVLAPTTCAVIVLIVILLVAFSTTCKKRGPQFDSMGPSGHEAVCAMREQRLLADYTTLSSNNQWKESCLSDLTEAPGKLYLQPFSCHELPPLSSRQQQQMQQHLNQQQQVHQQQQQHQLTDANINTLRLVDVTSQAKETASKQGHTSHCMKSLERQPFDVNPYDIPLPPKWV
ncbi:Down syndrome cell adhesion molecule-like protein 1 -like protein [Halotydeus destructor]|nr:Down syndrome cell adhesion molecule-like protein 1 -like protein [Halotydeus destructor]